MDDDKEAGELEDSGDEGVNSSLSNNTSNVPGGMFERMLLENKSLTDIQASAYDNDSRSSPNSYRSITPHAASSDDDSENSDEESMLWQCKRKKYHDKKQREKVSSTRHDPHDDDQNTPMVPSLPFNNYNSGRKVNNVWGNILTEQTLSQTFATVDMQRRPLNCYDDDRNVESYNYSRAQDDPRPRVELPDSDTEEPDPDQPTASELTAVESFGMRVVRQKRRNVKLRVEKRSYNKEKSRDHHGVTAEDNEEAIIKAMATSLKENKIDILERIVKRIGKERSLILLYETEDLEENGGMMTMDGRRRRTPGGVFIQLFKMDPDTTKADIRDIFFAPQKNQKKESRKRKHEYLLLTGKIQDHMNSITKPDSTTEPTPMDEQQNKCEVKSSPDTTQPEMTAPCNSQLSKDDIKITVNVNGNDMDEGELSDEGDLWDNDQSEGIILE